MVKNNAESPAPQLGAMLEAALDRSVSTSLDSFESLRTAVRAYARNQRNRGIPLDSVMRAVAAALMEIEDDRSREQGSHSVRDPNLARQLRAWCSEDYSTAF